MGEISPAEKFKIIDKLISNDNNELNITWLCDIAEVSRSGFYKWKDRQNNPNEKELQDQADFEIVLEAYNHRGYKKGSRSIVMWIMHHKPDKYMNRKKVQRLMRKYNLLCPIRKANPYRRMAKAIQQSTVADNLVNREFREHGARKVLLSDISYFFYGKYQKAFLSSLLDAYTKENLAYVLSDNLKEDFVLLTINDLIVKHSDELETDAIHHSDQGVHYKAYSLQQLLKDNNLRQSMSRKANCWDNAPKESFFGHMKDHTTEKLKDCHTFEEVKKVIDDYMDYYNNDRYQWKLAKLSPRQYYHYCKTGNHPLGLKEKEDIQEEKSSNKS